MEAGLSFSVEPVTGASGYRMQIARDAEFGEVIDEVVADGPQAHFGGLPDGTYYLRTTARAASGLEGMPAVSRFRRLRLGVNAQAGTSGLPGAVRFRWQSVGEGPLVYRFQLAAVDRPDALLVDRRDLSRPETTLLDLPSGTYRWRVGAARLMEEGLAEVWTEPELLTIAR